jgi:hypothetical protein
MSTKITQLELPFDTENFPKNNEDALKKYIRSVFESDLRSLFAKETAQNKVITLIVDQIREIDESVQYDRKRLDNLCKNLK